MTRKEQRRQEWIARVADYRSSSQTMKAWCEANRVTKDQLRYWLRTLKGQSSSNSKTPTARFVPLSIQESTSPSGEAPSLHLHIGSARIVLTDGFTPSSSARSSLS